MYRLPAAALLAAVLLVAAAAGARAQRHWSGMLDGVFPVGVTVNADDITGALRLRGRGGRPIDLVGSCGGDRCRLAARDTALAVEVFAFANHAADLALTWGDGRVQRTRLRATDEALPLPASCATNGEVVHSASTDGAFEIVRAGRHGRLYVASQGVSLAFALADATDGRRASPLRDDASRVVGSIALSYVPYDIADLDARVELGGTTTDVRFERTDAVALGCRSRDHRFDMTFPLVSAPGATSSAYAKRVDGWWDALTEPGASEATAWFEPTRLDERVLSGWMYLVRTPHTDGDDDDGGGAADRPVEAEAIAITLDRKTGRPLRDATLLGPKAGRSRIGDDARERTRGRHALYDQPGFRRWSKKRDLHAVAVLPEGLNLGGHYHPAYGALAATLPWSEVSYAKRLPAWMTEYPTSPNRD